jgi:hypothetical protein
MERTLPEGAENTLCSRPLDEEEMKEREIKRLKQRIGDLGLENAQHSTYGYRRIRALLRFREGQLVNRKKIYRLMMIKGRMLH